MKDAIEHLCLGLADYAAWMRRLEELRTIRDRDLPDLLREARAFASSDEVLQIRADLDAVTTQISTLEAWLSSARVVE